MGEVCFLRGTVLDLDFLSDTPEETFSTEDFHWEFLNP